ncbi:MAG: shikimate dehydrogenase [Thermoleophilaceae bacterium]
MTALAAVLGFPVGHSRSPAMHNAAFEALGLDWRYLKLPVPPERFEETVRALPASGYRGVNVTIPHKRAALELADEASPAAQAIGAANTLTFEGGRITADNTDAPGLLDALSEVPRTAMVLGAGGAGRAAAWALREAGAEVLVWNRTPERAERLASELGVEAVPEPIEAELLVNATSVGLDPATTEEQALEELHLSAIRNPKSAILDLVYGDTPPALTRWATANASRVIDGLEILVRQGARSFSLWTGVEAPIEDMRSAARIENEAYP